MQLYIVVGCKTGGCNTVHVLMHLGEKGRNPAKIEYWMCYPLILTCPTCGETYDYSNTEEKFWQKELPAPPAGYFDRPEEGEFACQPFTELIGKHPADFRRQSRSGRPVPCEMSHPSFGASVEKLVTHSSRPRNR